MRPTLYLMLGYPGSGKTTVSHIISDITGAVHLWADDIRRHTIKTPTYSHAENRRLYDSMNQQAAQLLTAGQSVIFDTSFNLYEDRELLRQLAARANANAVLLWVKVPIDTARKRATTNAHINHTRALGDMSHEDFDRLHQKLEEPRANEQYLLIDGSNVSPDYIKKVLNLR